MESVTRVRLVFENGHILSNSQRSEGLNRSWLLLKPQQLQTISDLSSYLLNFFDLHQSCTNGLLLSMDGFVLPPFESTCIIKDKDVISVKKKGGSLSAIIEGRDKAISVEEEEIVEKQPVHTAVPLLANEEFEKESAGYQSEIEEDEEDQPEDTSPAKNSSDRNAVSKKRKGSKKLQSSKKKKRRLVVPDGVENDVHTEHIESYHNGGVLHRKSLRKKEKVFDSKSKLNMDSTSEIAQRNNDNGESMLDVKRNDQLQENGEGIKDVSHVPQGTKKIPSRSARRKKAKRKWLKEVAKAEKKDDSCHPKGLLHWKQERAKAKKKEVLSQPKGLLHWKKLPEKDVQKAMIELEQPNQNSDVEDDVVPVEVRPGHIRFEPLGKEQAVQQTPVSVETIQWNRITSKKKGQKWGKVKFSSAQRNDYKDLNKENSEALATEKEIHINFPIDFDKLPPLTTLAEEGDVIAYRLIELSSTWTPELSSFRVGRISWCDPQSTQIVLMPIPGYPIISENKDEDASELQPDNSLYMEDGKLEIDFKLLIDVRVVKHGDSIPAKPIAGKQAQASTPENGEVNPWDRFGEVVYAKKAQVYGENGYYRIRK